MKSRLTQLQALLALDPNDAFLLYALAMEQAKAGELDAAVASFDRCLAVDPAHCYAYYHKGKLLAEADRTTEAVGVLQQGIAAARKHQDAKALGELSTLLDSLT